MSRVKEMVEFVNHIKDHIQYPASKADIVEACNNMSDIPEEDKEWVRKNLPDKTYNSMTDVVEALGVSMAKSKL